MDKMRLDLSAPHQTYKTRSGKVCTGVTTILGVLAKDGLTPWAAKIEREGCRAHFARYGELDTLPRPYFFAGARDKAADLGTIAHAHIEAWLRGMELDPDGLDPALYEAALAPRDRFVSWWNEEGLTLVQSEWQGVHEQDEYGGTIDFVARDFDGALVLGDIKTTKANKAWPYATVVAQVAAYKRLWESWTDQGKVSRVVVVRVGKEASDKGEQVWLDSERVDAGLDLFKAAHAAYKATKELERLS